MDEQEQGSVQKEESSEEMMASGTRKTHIFDRIELEWKESPFEHLTRGDIFRLFEPDGSPVRNDKGNIFVCLSEAPYEIGNILGVRITPIEVLNVRSEEEIVERRKGKFVMQSS